MAMRHFAVALIAAASIVVSTIASSAGNVTPKQALAQGVTATPRAKPAQQPVRHLIVKLRDSATGAPAAGRPGLREIETATGVELTHVRELAGGASLVALRAPVPPAEARNIAATLARQAGVEYAGARRDVQAAGGSERSSGTPEWQWNLFEPTATFTGTLLGGNGSKSAVATGGANLPPAWDVTQGGSGVVVVAVIDTGIVNHPDLNGVDAPAPYVASGRFVGGYDFISSNVGSPTLPLNFVANDGDDRDPDPTDPGNWLAAGDVWRGGWFCRAGGQQLARNAHGRRGRGERQQRNRYRRRRLERPRAAAPRARPVWRGVDRHRGRDPLGRGPRRGRRADESDTGAGDQPEPRQHRAMHCPHAVRRGRRACRRLDRRRGHRQRVRHRVDLAGQLPWRHRGDRAHDQRRERRLRQYRRGNDHQRARRSVIILGAGGPTDDANWTGYYIWSTLLYGATDPWSADAQGRTGAAYGGFTGTSVAAPHVAGAAALVKSLLPSASPEQVRGFLVNDVRPFPAGSACATGGAFEGQCGAGLLDVSAAVDRAVLSASPVIVSGPQNLTIVEGQTATLAVTAAGAATLTYQWKRYGVDIAGATSPTYTTPALSVGDSGTRYSVTVTNPLGSITSSEATITVVPVGTGGPATPPVNGGGGGGGALPLGQFLLLIALLPLCAYVARIVRRARCRTRRRPGAPAARSPCRASSRVAGRRVRLLEHHLRPSAGEERDGQPQPTQAARAFRQQPRGSAGEEQSVQRPR